VILLSALGSWRLTVFLALAAVAAYLSFLPSQDAFGAWTRFLFESIWGQALLAALSMNLVFMSMEAVRRKFQPVPIKPCDLDWCVGVPSGGRHLPEDMAGWAREKRFSPQLRGSVLTARRGAFSLVPGTVLRAGLIMLILAFFLSAKTRQTGEVTLSAGEGRVLLGETVTVTEIESGLPSEHLETGREGSLFLPHVSALITVSGTPVRVTNDYPVSIHGQDYRLTGLGYDLPLFIEYEGNSLPAGGHMDILPPGRTQTTFIEECGYTVSVTLEPEETIKKGLITGKVYDLHDPGFRIGLKKGPAEPVETVMRPGEVVEIDGTSVTLEESAVSVRLLAVKDPALRWIHAGAVLALLGLLLMPLRLFWYERRLSMKVSYESILIGYQQEFFRKWAEVRLKLWAAELRIPDDAGNTDASPKGTPPPEEIEEQ
jgi:hypothetical protein